MELRVGEKATAHRIAESDIVTSSFEQACNQLRNRTTTHRKARFFLARLYFFK